VLTKKIAIIGANLPLLNLYKQTKSLGYEIHSFAWEEGAICREYADFFYPISIKEKGKILKICREVKINGITSFTLESALPTVNYVANALNLCGNPESCVKFTANKYSMRQKLFASKISIPQFNLINNKTELNELNPKFPVIVKPIDNGGSRGITKVNNKNELLSSYKRALENSKLKKVLVEQYIEGREFSVEYISYKGKHYFVAVTDKVTTGAPYFVELEHHQPAFINDAQKKAIQTITEDTLTALDVYSSASHTEIKMDKNGKFFVIEVGARMGGDMIGSDLVRLSTSYDYVKGCLELACGKFIIPEIKNEKYSGIYFLSKETESLGKYFLNSNFQKEIVRKEKYSDSLRQIRESGDRSGFLIYQSDKKFEIRL